LLNNRQCQASLTIDATPRVMKYTCSIGSKGACITHLRKRKLHGLEVRTDSIEPRNSRGRELYG